MNDYNLSREGSGYPDGFDTRVGPTIRHQLALVVGIDTYRTGFTPLRNAAGDALSIAQLLASEYGFTAVLADDRQPFTNEAATWAALRSAVEESLHRPEADLTRWLFYFAGHGTVVDRVSYLIPVNASCGDTNTYLSLSWLLEQCRKSPCAEVLILLDACRSGGALVRDEHLSDLLINEAETRVRQIVTSGSPSDPVLDGGGSGHSIFTQALLDGLGGWTGIHEEDGRVRFGALLDYLAYEIPGRLLGASYGAAHQQPIGGNFQGNSQHREFVFRPTCGRLPPDPVRDLRSENPAQRVEAFRRLLDAPPTEPAPRTQAAALAVRHLRYRADDCGEMPVVGRLLRYEPFPEVRARGGGALGTTR